MFIWKRMLIDGCCLSILASLYIIIILKVNPRLVLQNYRADIQQAVPPKTEREKRLSVIIGIPFLIFVFAVPFLSTLLLKLQLRNAVGFLLLFRHAFGISFMFNLVDLLVLDLLLFCLITPKFIVLPGTEGMKAYKDFKYHLSKAVKGTLISGIAGLVIAGIVWLI